MSSKPAHTVGWITQGCVYICKAFPFTPSAVRYQFKHVCSIDCKSIWIRKITWLSLSQFSFLAKNSKQ